MTRTMLIAALLVLCACDYATDKLVDWQFAEVRP